LPKNSVLSLISSTNLTFVPYFFWNLSSVGCRFSSSETSMYSGQFANTRSLAISPLGITFASPAPGDFLSSPHAARYAIALTDSAPAAPRWTSRRRVMPPRIRSSSRRSKSVLGR
jgi:hypothetical protein